MNKNLKILLQSLSLCVIGALFLSSNGFSQSKMSQLSGFKLPKIAYADFKGASSKSIEIEFSDFSVEKDLDPLARNSCTRTAGQLYGRKARTKTNLVLMVTDSKQDSPIQMVIKSGSTVFLTYLSQTDCLYDNRSNIIGLETSRISRHKTTNERSPSYYKNLLSFMRYRDLSRISDSKLKSHLSSIYGWKSDSPELQLLGAKKLKVKSITLQN